MNGIAKDVRDLLSLRFFITRIGADLTVPI